MGSSISLMATCKKQQDKPVTSGDTADTKLLQFDWLSTKKKKAVESLLTYCK